MLYKKPDNLTLTQLCMYVDEKAYSEEHDPQHIFEYLFHICRALAREYRYFSHNKYYYDDFAIYAATRLYLRLTNKKQFELDEKGNPKLKKIKSILNFTSAIIYKLKVDFEQSEYYHTPKIKNEEEYYINYNSEVILNNYSNDFSKLYFKIMIEEAASLCEECLQSLLINKKSSLYMNILTSIKLSLIKQFTLTKTDKKEIKNLIKTNRLLSEHINEFFNQKQNKIILFHLGNSYKDLITILCRKVKSYIGQQLAEELYYNSLDEETLKVILEDYHKQIEGYLDEEYL